MNIIKNYLFIRAWNINWIIFELQILDGILILFKYKYCYVTMKSTYNAKQFQDEISLIY